MKILEIPKEKRWIRKGPEPYKHFVDMVNIPISDKRGRWYDKIPSPVTENIM